MEQQKQHSNEVLLAVIKEFNSKALNEFFSRLNPPSVIDDLKQEMFLKLLEKEPDILEGLVERNQLFAFIVGMSKLTITSEKTQFHRLQRKSTGSDLHPNLENIGEYFAIDEQEEQDIVLTSVLTGRGKPIIRPKIRNRIKLQAAYYQGKHSGFFPMTTAIINLPVVVSFTNVQDTDQLNDELENLHTVCQSLIGGVHGNLCISKISEPQVHEVVFAK